MALSCSVIAPVVEEVGRPDLSLSLMLVRPYLNFRSIHIHYTMIEHYSPYYFERLLWISVPDTPSDHKNRMTAHWFKRREGQPCLSCNNPQLTDATDDGLTAHKRRHRHHLSAYKRTKWYCQSTDDYNKIADTYCLTLVYSYR